MESNLKQYYLVKVMTHNRIYNLKKVYPKTKVQRTSAANSVLRHVDEKGPITAKTHGDPSWSSIQVKIERAQKINGLLYVFGAYDHTNDKMHLQCY